MASPKGNVTTYQALAGKVFERKLAELFRAKLPRHRALVQHPPVQPTFKDIGDMHVGPFTFQIKHIPTGLRTVLRYVEAAAKQARQAGLAYHAVIVMNPDFDTPANALVVLPVHEFLPLLEAYLASLD